MKKTIGWALPFLLGTGLTLSACHQNNNEPAGDLSQQQQQDAEVMQQLQTPPVKDFPATAQDAHDIALLEDYESRFLAMSDELEEELARMRQAGDLTPEFERQRQREHAQSARDMLRELDLKTEQGRYIQGLHAEYWDTQARLLDQQEGAAANRIRTQGLTDYLHAQEQLKHWKNRLEASASAQKPVSEQ